MSVPAIISNLIVQQGNGQAHLQWDAQAAVTSYTVQRSLDGLMFTLSIPVAATAYPSYFDDTVLHGVQYFYQVFATNVFGDGATSPIQSVVPTQNGEMSLGELRTRSQQRADRLNSDFVTLSEWNSYINQSMSELYDLLTDQYEDYSMAEPFQIKADGTTFRFPLPDGAIQYYDQANALFYPVPFYKLLGVDLAINTSANAYVTINKFNFMDRNRFVYPNTASTIYGVFNLQYRMVGNFIEFIPTPSANQLIRLWYIPRLEILLGDSSVTTIGVSGWLEYVIVDAAIKALQKEESDVSVLMAQKQALIKRIQDSAMNRDAGQPDRISDIRQQGQWGNGGWGTGNGPIGGIAALPLGLLPDLMAHNSANVYLAHAVHLAQFSLTHYALGILAAYLLYKMLRKSSGRISLPLIGDRVSHCAATFFSHIRHIVGLRSNKQMVGTDTFPVVAPMTDIQLCRNSAVVDLPGKPVCPDKSLPGITTRLYTHSWVRHSYDAVARVINLASPLPAVIRFVNLFPKFLNKSAHNKETSLLTAPSQGGI